MHAKSSFSSLEFISKTSSPLLDALNIDQKVLNTGKADFNAFNYLNSPVSTRRFVFHASIVHKKQISALTTYGMIKKHSYPVH